MYEFISWLFLTLLMFLIVFIFVKILETSNRIHKQKEIDERMEFIIKTLSKIDKIIKENDKGGKNEKR